jgi:superfamily I DNA/RNA helicase
MFNPSNYQSAIFDWIVNGKGNAVIEAKAGSGKTTTIVEALKHIPANQTCLFLAFNKAIATELQTRVPKNVEACTLNSFGYAICRKNIKKYIKIDGDKTSKTLRYGVLKFEANKSEEQKIWYYQNRQAIIKLVSLLKANNLREVNMAIVDELSMKYDITIKDNDLNRFVQILEQTFKATISTMWTMDFDDQIFFPVYYNWAIPTYAWVFVDEAQDLNPIQKELILKCSA